MPSNASNPSSAIADCTRSYRLYGHSETQFEVIENVDGDAKIQDAEQREAVKGYRYSPYMETLLTGHGPKVGREAFLDM